MLVIGRQYVYNSNKCYLTDSNRALLVWRVLLSDKFAAFFFSLHNLMINTSDSRNPYVTRSGDAADKLVTFIF